MADFERQAKTKQARFQTCFVVDPAGLAPA